jgi:hypothetical protein
MLIARFAPSTEWAGTEIAREDDGFVLEGRGAISASEIMAYDSQGQLEWADEGTRAWVGALAKTTASTPLSTTTSATPHRRVSRLSLLIAGGSLAVVVVALVLAFSGAIDGKPQPASSPSQAAVVQATTPAASSQTPTAQDASWPSQLAGTWVSPGGMVSRIIVGEDNGQPVIQWVDQSGDVSNWVFFGEQLALVLGPSDGADAGPFGRIGGSSKPYTGTYRLVTNQTTTNTSGVPVTVQVSFSGSSLTLDMTNGNGWGEFTRRDIFTLSPDGQRLRYNSNWTPVGTTLAGAPMQTVTADLTRQ